MATTKNTPEESAGPQQGSQAGPAGARISKKEGVRRALAELGRDATTGRMQGWLKEHLGIDMTLGHISTTRGELRRAEAGGGKPAKKPAAPRPAPQKSAAREAGAQGETPGPQGQPTPAPTPGGAGGIPLEDILAVKDLVGRLGAGPLHTLIDAFSR